MYEDIFVKANEDKDAGVKYYIMKTRWDSGSVDMKESHANGQNIARGLSKVFKHMEIPISVKFKLLKIDGMEDRWSFYLTIEDEKVEDQNV